MSFRNVRGLAVQVYPSRDKASGAPLMEAALRIGGRWFRVNAQGEHMPLDLDGWKGR